jgi:hypothetical protein
MVNCIIFIQICRILKQESLAKAGATIVAAAATQEEAYHHGAKEENKEQR